MFRNRQTDESPTLQDAINALLYEMQNVPSDSDQYAILQKRFVELYSSKKVDHEINRTSRISPDVMLTVGANLIGILLIIKHEEVNVIATKALGFVMKAR